MRVSMMRKAIIVVTYALATTRVWGSPPDAWNTKKEGYARKAIEQILDVCRVANPQLVIQTLDAEIDANDGLAFEIENSGTYVKSTRRVALGDNVQALEVIPPGGGQNSPFLLFAVEGDRLRFLIYEWGAYQRLQGLSEAGYDDLAVGTHASAEEGGVAYFSYDGQKYSEYARFMVRGPLYRYRKGLEDFHKGQVRVALAAWLEIWLDRRGSAFPEEMTAELLNNIGYGFAKLQKSDKAIDYLTQVLALDPNRAIAHLNLGEVYDSLHDCAGARRSYERFLQLKPADKSAQEIRGRIERCR